MVSLDQFQQHARRALRMHEHITMPARARLDLIRYQAHAFALQFRNRRRQVRNARQT